MKMKKLEWNKKRTFFATIAILSINLAIYLLMLTCYHKLYVEPILQKFPPEAQKHVDFQSFFTSFYGLITTYVWISTLVPWTAFLALKALGRVPKTNTKKSILLAILLVTITITTYTTTELSAKTYTFTWTKEQQSIVNGTLCMEISFQWKNENLSIRVKINDGKPYGFGGIPNAGLLLLVFDRNGNGKIDGESPHPTGPEPEPSTEKAYAFSSSNLYWEGCTLNYAVGIAKVRSLPIKSPYHTCTFKEGVGFTYYISIPRAELENVKLNDVAVVYEGISYRYFDTDWVYAYIKGWQ